MTVAKALPQDLIANLLADYKKPEDLIGENGLLKQITKALVERALEAEMEAHLGHGKNEPVANASGNTRNQRIRGGAGLAGIAPPHCATRAGLIPAQRITLAAAFAPA